MPRPFFRRTILIALLAAGLAGVLLRHGKRDAVAPPPRAAQAVSTAEPAAPRKPVLAPPAQPAAADCCPGAVLPSAVPRVPAAPLLEPEQIAKALEDFRLWAERYKSARVAEQPALAAQGLLLALARRAAFAQLIRQDPKAAIDALLPYELRKSLPPEIADSIEHRVSGVGDLMVLAVRPLPGTSVEEPIYRTANLADQAYRAYTYGKRLADISRPQTPILGVGVNLPTGNLLAVKDEAYQVLDKAEAADIRAQQGVTNAVCPVSGAPTESKGDETAVDTGVKIVWLCSHGHIGQYLQSPEGLIIAAAGGTGNSGNTSPVVPATYTEGNKTLLAIRVRFSDQAAEPTSDSNMQTQLQAVVDQWHAWSYGKTEATFTFTPTLVMPQTEAYYAAQGDPSGALLAAARAAADAYTDANNAHPYTDENFDFDSCVFSSGLVGNYCGLGYVGGKGTWIKCYSAGVMLHEWGHNLGLWHANFWQPSSDSPIGPGAHVEYGSKYSVMGSAGLNSYDTLERYTIHWLETTDGVDVQTSGTYHLYNADKSTLVNGHPYALRLRKDGLTYYVEFRPNWDESGTHFSTTNGVMICRTQPGSDADQLLDMNPLTSAGNDDASLLIGRSFTDAAQNFTVTPILHNGVAPDDYLDVVVNFNSPVTDSPPVAVVTASNYAPATGVAVTLNAVASDPDGDALAYSWDFGDGSSVSVNNSASQTKSWSTAGDYNVRCIVSDMKGKTAVQNTVIHVGAPATFTISGRVTKSDGTPVQDVLIEDTNSHLIYTDADGRYTLGALAAGSYTLTALHSGWTLTPQFANPVVIGPSAVNVNFTATAPAATGGITLEHWDGISGTLVTDLTGNAAYPNSPSYHYVLESLAEGQTDFADNYGQRMRGWFKPPVTGAYTFYIASDDNSELWLSTNDLAANKVKIASVTGYTTSRQWTKFASQKSAAITLTAGQRYYIEALQKEGGGGDNLAVGVDFPSAAQHRPIESTYLDPITAATPATPADTVTVAATDASASETGPDPGTFTITRTGDMTNALTVFFDMTGTATYGADYAGTGLSATIAAGDASATVTVTPIDDTIAEADETVILTLSPALTYTLGASASATVVIHDNEPAQVSIVATDATASETGGDTGTFTITRTGDTTSALTVNFTIGGSATNGADYPTLTPSVTIPAGQSTAAIVIAPINDGVIEPEETVILTLAAGLGYTVTTPNTATVRITAQPGTGGGILREWFDGLNGNNTVADLLNAASFPNAPTGSAIVTSVFETPQSSPDKNNYGERWRAIFTAPISGAYYFYIASDDASDLWLSTNATPERKQRICYASSATGFENWTAQGNQKSAAITLTAGQRYYIEALFKEGVGGDYMSVGVEYPNGALERPIPAHRLDPFTPSTAVAAPWVAQDVGATGSPGASGIASDSLPTGPTHRYSFTGTANAAIANGATLTDSIGTAHAALRGAGAVFNATGTGVDLPGGSSATQAYIDLPNGVITGTIGGGTRYTSATYETWVTVTSTQNWARIFNFGTSSIGEVTAPGGTFAADDAHHIFLTASNGTGADQRLSRYYPAGTTDVWSDTSGTAVNGTQYHIVMVYDAVAQNWRWYRNGMLMHVLADAQGLTTINDVNNWLGRSMWSPDSNIDATFDEFRIYNYALTEAQIAGNRNAGPGVVNTAAAVATGPYYESGSGVLSTNGATDAFHFDAQPLAGDWDVRVQLASLTNPNAAAIAGLMMRDGTAANAREVFVGLTPDAAGHFIARTTAGGNAATVNQSGLAFPQWLRLMRLGQTLYGYVSADGATWTAIGSPTAFTGLGSTVQVGFAVASGTAVNASALAQFASFSRTTLYVWSNMASATNPWTTAANWLGGIAAQSNPAVSTEFFTGQTLVSGAITANNDNAGTFQTGTLRLAGTGPASGATTVTLAGGALAPAAVIALDATNGTGLTYTVGNPITLSGATSVTGSGTATFILAGSISGAGALNQSGSALLALTGSSTFAGGTTIASGSTLRVGNGGATGSLGGAIVNSGTLDLRRIDTALNVAGVISGTGAITVNGSLTSIVTLSGANTFTGAVTATVGGLRITNAGALGSGAKTVTLLNGTAGNPNLRLDGSGGDIALPATISFTTSNVNGAIINEAGNNTVAGNFTLTSGGGDSKLLVNAGTLTASGIFTANTTLRNLVLDGAGNGTFSGSLQNNGANIPGLTKSGAGTWTVSGANTYTGATLISAGTLAVNGSIATGGSVTVASGATLSGTGSIAAATTVNGNHAPGLAIGTQTFTGALGYGAGGRLKWALAGNTVAGAGTSFDQVAAAAVTVANGAVIDVIVNTAGSTVDFTNSFWSAARSWTVLTGTSVTGSSFAVGTVTNDPAAHFAANYGTFAVQQTATKVNLTWTPFAPMQVWKNLKFGIGSPNAADTLDPDKDGLSNLAEYGMNLDPNTPNPQPQMTIEGGYLTLTYTRLKNAPDITMQVKWSTDLGIWSATGITEDILADDGTTQTVKSKVPTAPDTKKYLRIEFTHP